MSIECCVCEGTGAHDFTGLTGEIETETCHYCDGTGNRTCDLCDQRAVKEVSTFYAVGRINRTVIDYLCKDCYIDSDIEGNT